MVLVVAWANKTISHQHESSYSFCQFNLKLCLVQIIDTVHGNFMEISRGLDEWVRNPAFQCTQQVRVEKDCVGKMLVTRLPYQRQNLSYTNEPNLSSFNVQNNMTKQYLSPSMGIGSVKFLYAFVNQFRFIQCKKYVFIYMFYMWG